MNENAINIKEVIEYNEYIAIIYDDITNPELPQYHICPVINNKVYPISLGVKIMDGDIPDDPKEYPPVSVTELYDNKNGAYTIELECQADDPFDELAEGLDEIYIERNDNILSYRCEYDLFDSVIYVLDVIESEDNLKFIYEVIELVSDDCITLEKEIMIDVKHIYEINEK